MSAISSARFDTRARSSGQTPHMFKRVGNIAQCFCGDMGIPRRRGQLGMAEQDLYHTNIRIGLQQMRREAMAQCVQRRRLLIPAIRLADVNARFN